MKFCNTCKNDLPITSFSLIYGTNSPRSRCKKCTAKNAAKYRLDKKNGEYQNRTNYSKIIDEPSKYSMICKKCKILKSLNEFYLKTKKEINRLSHWSTICKLCERDSRHLRWKSGYRTPGSKSLDARLMSIKHRTTRNGVIVKKWHGKEIKINLTIYDIRKLLGIQTINGKLYCAATGIELIDQFNHPLRPSLDRIDSFGDYVLNNSRITSMMYNYAKSSLSDSEYWNQLNLSPTPIYDTYEFAKKMLSRKKRSNIRKLPIELTIDDIKTLIDSNINNHGFVKCSATDMLLTATSKLPLSLSLDRIDNKYGYIAGNVHIVAKTFNLARNNTELTQAKQIWEQLYDHLQKRWKLHFFQDESKNKPELFFRLLINKLHKITIIKIRPQHCEIRLIIANEANKFYSKYHYIGPTTAKFHIGVFYQDILIACLSIRKPTRQNAGNWEISRMASHYDYRINGIWSYLIKWIKIRKLIIGSLITYSDNRIYTGEVYKHMGFEHCSNIKPDYYWMKDGVRYHKSKMRKNEDERTLGLTENELRIAQGYHKVFDDGKKKWIIIL